MNNKEIILDVKNLNTSFVSDRKEVKIVKNVSVSIEKRSCTCCGRRVWMWKECDYEFYHEISWKKCCNSCR